MKAPRIGLSFSLSFAGLIACQGTHDERAPRALAERGTAASPGLSPIAGARPCDDLISPGEKHFAHLFQLTSGIENAAEAYWNGASNRLTMQVTTAPGSCDQIFVTSARGTLERISNGRGLTTCSYFLPGDQSVLYASTHAFQLDCPAKPDPSQGYTWRVHPEFDIYVHDLATGREQALTSEWGYDAEATVSPKGDRIVFTSSRSGDLELWTCDIDGGHLKQVTDAAGYDGGAFFSHSGEELVFRSTTFTPGKETEEIAAYRTLLKSWLVRPTRMEIMLTKSDGTGRRPLTHLGKANWAPYFFPDDSRVIFATNHHNDKPGMPNFDLFAIDVDGRNLEPITTYAEFDSFPMFSPDGRFLVFASNRGGTRQGETNLFLAEWR